MKKHAFCITALVLLVGCFAWAKLASYYADESRRSRELRDEICQHIFETLSVRESGYGEARSKDEQREVGTLLQQRLGLSQDWHFFGEDWSIAHVDAHNAVFKYQSFYDNGNGGSLAVSEYFFYDSMTRMETKLKESRLSRDANGKSSFDESALWD